MKPIYEISCADRIDPPLSIDVQWLPLPDDLSVLIIEVEPSTSVYKSPGGFYSRQGSSKRELSSEAVLRLYLQRSKSGWLGPDEVIVVNTGVNTLEDHLVNRILSSRSAESKDDQLKKMGLVRSDENSVIRATIAGVLLCTEQPDSFIPGAKIEAVRYNGTTMGVARQHDARTITGPLDRQIRDAVNFVRLNTKVAARKDPARIETPQFSPRMVFESIVNAVVHRDYTIENSKIRIFMFDDRLELYSPGTLPNNLSLEAMRSRQATRNEVLASILRMIPVGEIYGAGDRPYFMEQRGEGVPVIYEQTLSLTGIEPEYELLDGTELRLTVPSAMPPVEEGIEGEVMVFTNGEPIAGVQVVAIYPNKTYIKGTTDNFGRVSLEFHSKLPVTVFCAGLGYKGHVTRNWNPPEPLLIRLKNLPSGGSTIITDRLGKLPDLIGWLKPKLDCHDRMYLYSDGELSIEKGKQQPVQFKLNQPLFLTDVKNSEKVVKFIEMIGTSALIEHESPESKNLSVDSD